MNTLFQLSIEIYYFIKRVTPITMKSILPSGPLKTKLIIINYNNHDKKRIYKIIRPVVFVCEVFIIFVTSDCCWMSRRL